MIRNRAWAVCLCALACAPLHVALATTTYSDGLTHSVSGGSVDINLLQSTTLNVLNGTLINAAVGLDAVGAYDMTANHISVSGGTLTSAANPQQLGGFGANGAGMQGGFLNISGGSLRGGDATFVPGDGISTRNTDVTISGGTLQGANNTGFSYGGDGASINGGTIRITGGLFLGGNGSLAGTPIKLADGNAPISAHAIVSGGTFTPGTGNGIGGFSPFSFAIGYNGPSTMDLFGGTFNGGFYLEEHSVLNIYGHNLSMTSITNGKHLSGTLQSGQPISLDAFVKPTAVVNLIEVPEPGSLALAALGMVALGAVVWRGRRD